MFSVRGRFLFPSLQQITTNTHKYVWNKERKDEKSGRLDIEPFELYRVIVVRMMELIYMIK